MSTGRRGTVYAALLQDTLVWTGLVMSTATSTADVVSRVGLVLNGDDYLAVEAAVFADVNLIVRGGTGGSREQ